MDSFLNLPKKNCTQEMCDAENSMTMVVSDMREALRRAIDGHPNGLGAELKEAKYSLDTAGNALMILAKKKARRKKKVTCQKAQ